MDATYSQLQGTFVARDGTIKILRRFLPPSLMPNQDGENIHNPKNPSQKLHINSVYYLYLCVPQMF